MPKTTTRKVSKKNEAELLKLLQKIHTEDNQSIPQIHELVRKLTRTPKRKGGFVDDRALIEFQEWATAFLKELSDYFAENRQTALPATKPSPVPPAKYSNPAFLRRIFTFTRF